jgi:hypothetical protein
MLLTTAYVAEDLGHGQWLAVSAWHDLMRLLELEMRGYIKRVVGGGE